MLDMISTVPLTIHTLATMNLMRATGMPSLWFKVFAIRSAIESFAIGPSSSYEQEQRNSRQRMTQAGTLSHTILQARPVYRFLYKDWLLSKKYRNFSPSTLAI